jgi:hypothetical protein
VISWSLPERSGRLFCGKKYSENCFNFALQLAITRIENFLFSSKNKKSSLIKLTMEAVQTQKIKPKVHDLSAFKQVMEVVHILWIWSVKQSVI